MKTLNFLTLITRATPNKIIYSFPLNTSYIYPLQPKPPLKCSLIITRTSELPTQGISAVLRAIPIELTRNVVCDIAPWEPFNEDNQPPSHVLAGVVAVFQNSFTQRGVTVFVW